MRTYAVRILGVTLTLIGTNYAQTYTTCDPTNVTCPPTPGSDSSYYFIDFTTVKSTPSDWFVPTWCRVTYNTKGRQNGAELEFLERYDSQQLYSNFYFLFGRVEFVVQAAPGPGIISDMMTLSDDLDELDWEFRGSLDDEVQTGWFGKGVTGLYNHSVTPKIPSPMTQFHTYSFDWTPDRVIWEDDGVVVRTLYASDCIGTANQYPQTPMKAMIGLWDAGDPDDYDPWAAGMTPIPPPAGGYSFYVKSVKIWNTNPAACYNWTDHSGSWQSIKALNDPSACGINSKSSSTIISSSSIPSSSSKIMSSLSGSFSSSSLSVTSSFPVTSSPAIASATTAMSLSPMIASSLSTSSSSSTTASSPPSPSSSPMIASSSSAASTIESSSSAVSSLPQPSAIVSTPLMITSSGSSMKLALSMQSATTEVFPSKVSSSRPSLNTQVSSILASSVSMLGTHSSSAQMTSTSASSIHLSNLQPSSTHPPSTLSDSTQSLSPHLSNALPLTLIQSSTTLSAATSSSPSLSSSMPIAVHSIQTNASPTLKGTATISASSQISAPLPTSTGKASISSSLKAGSMTGFTATMNTASSIAPGALSGQTSTYSKITSSASSKITSSASSKIISSASRGSSVASSTGVVDTSPPSSPGIKHTTTGLPTMPLTPMTAAPGQNTVTIVVVLPGPHTLSYSYVVEDWSKLVDSLEELIPSHHSKRQLATVSSESSGLISQNRLLDPIASRHHHGHQHGHLHDQLRARSIGNTSHTTLLNSTVASTTSGPWAEIGTDAAATGNDQATSVVEVTTVSASLSDHPTDQSTKASASASALADSQDSHAPLESVDFETTIPESLIADQSTVSQPNPSYSDAGSTGAKSSTQSILQQQFSAAGRNAPFEKSRLSASTMMCSLCVFLIAVHYP